MKNTDEKSRHFFQLDKPEKRIRVYFDDHLIADSKDSYVLKEVGKQVYDDVYYIPHEDVNMKFFTSEDNYQTTCPIKGEASYLNYQFEQTVKSKIAWTYKEPLKRAERIKNHIAFYADKVSFRIDPVNL